MYHFHVKIYSHSQLVYSGCEWVLSNCSDNARIKLNTIISIRHGSCRSIIWLLNS